MLTHQVSQSGHMTPVWPYQVHTAPSQPSRRRERPHGSCIEHHCSNWACATHLSTVAFQDMYIVPSIGFLCLQETQHPQMSALFDYLTIFMHDTYMHGSIRTISLYQKIYKYKYNYKYQFPDCTWCACKGHRPAECPAALANMPFLTGLQIGYQSHWETGCSPSHPPITPCRSQWS